MNLLDPVLLEWRSFDWLASLVVVSLKGAVVLAAAGLLCLALRRGHAAVRHALWGVSLCGLLLMPLLSYALQGWQLAVLPAGPFTAAGESRDHSARPGDASPAPRPAQGDGLTGAAARAGTQSPRATGGVEGWGGALSWPNAFLLLWLAGVLAVSCRLIVGLVCANRMRRGAVLLEAEPWTSLSETLSDRIGLTRRVSLMRSDSAAVPLTCGIFSPVVLLPADAESWSPERRLAVLLHELSHVKRRDVLTQMSAQAVCALHWFNPLVWYAARQLRKEQEWACDECVVSAGVAAPDYARHLLDIARESHSSGWSAAATTAMAGGSQLEERLRAILSPAHGRARASRAATVCIAIVCSLLLPLGGIELVRAKETARLQDGGTAETVRRADGVPLSSRAQSATGQVGSGEQPADGRVAGAPEGHPLRAASATPAAGATPAVPDVTEGDGQSAAAQPTPQRSEDEMTTASQRSFTDEEKNHLRNNGIGPEYIREMEGAGYGGLSAAQLVALFSNGVRADYVAELRRAGYDGLPAKELIALRTNGIDADVIKSFKAVEYADFKARNYIAFKSNGVTPSYLKSMKALGYGRLTPKQIVDMWVAEVTPEFVRKARAAGGSDLSPERLIELRRADNQ